MVDEIHKKSKLEIALEIASLGYRIVPIHGLIGGVCTCGKINVDGHKPGKHPACPNGVNDATTDRDTITNWFRDAPWLNLAIALDRDAFVIDIDPKNGGDKTLAEWETEHGSFPKTPTVKTGSGGRHFYFKRPPDAIVKNRPVAKGIDSKTIGGYVLVPPSNHESGNVYEWIEPLTTPLADPPQWLLAIVSDGVDVDGVRRSATNTTSVNEDDGEFVMACESDFDSHPGVSENRSQTLWRLIGSHKRRGDSVDDIEAKALAWNVRNSPPLPESKIVKQVHDLFRKPDTFSFNDDSGGRVRTDERVCRMSYVVRGDDGDTPYDIRHTTYEIGSSEVVSSAHVDPSGLRHTTQTTRAAKDDLGNAEVIESATPSGLRHTTYDTTNDNDQNPTPNLNPAIDDFEDAYHGILGDIVKAIEPETEADPMAVLVSMLVHAGNAIGKGAWTEATATKHYPNEFCVLVGDTASGKGQTEDVCEYLLRKVDPDFEERHGSGLSSGEGLIERVRDDENEDDGDVFSIRSEKRFIAIESEFGRTITVARRDGNTLSPILRDAWDGKPLSVLTRSGNGTKTPRKPLRASDAHVSIIAHITPTELTMAMSKTSGINEIANGFANRFLWCFVKRSKLLPSGGNVHVLDPFVETLSAKIADARRLGRIARTSAAEALWASVYGELTSAKPGAFGLVVSRSRPHVLRLSLIYAALDGSRVVDVCHLKAALVVWRHCEESARRLFGTPSPTTSVYSGVGVGSDEPLVCRLMNAITQTPGVHRRDLRRTVQPDSDSVFDNGLTYLESNRMAYRKSVSTGGRSAEAWYPGDPGTENDDDIQDDGDVFTMGADDPSPSDDETATCHKSYVGRVVDGSATIATSCRMSYVGSAISHPSDIRHMTNGEIDTSSTLYGFGDWDMASEKLTYFVDAITHKGLTVEQARNPQTLTHRQLKDRDWCYRYATAQAERVAREREMASREKLSDEDFDNELFESLQAIAGETWT